MYGAIIGDVVGSRFEFDRSPKVKEFELFTKGNYFTDISSYADDLHVVF